jgi:benzoylformate decarboxylase
MVIQGNAALVELLVQEGIDLMVGNPGTTELPLMDTLGSDSRVRYVLGLQESIVVGVADGYAQATGRLVAVNLHAAPGLGNALGMLFNAKKAGSPILVTAGQQDQSVLLSEPILAEDLTTMARPLVKWSYEVRRLADLPRAVHRAATTALAPPTGPVFLSIPSDVLTDTADLDLGSPTRIATRVRPDPSAVEQAAHLVASARSPIIFAGDAVARAHAHGEMVRFAELVGAPVYAEDLANSASFPTSHPLFAGTIPRLGGAIRAVLSGHDLLISIGADLFTLSLSGGPQPVPPGLPIVHVDADPWQLGKNFPTSAAILGDPRMVLPEICEAIERVHQPGGIERPDDGRPTNDVWPATDVRPAMAARRQAVHARAEGLAGDHPIPPMALLHALGQALPRDVVVVEEALSSNEGVRLLISSDDPQSFYGMRGGGIGWALPAAIGIKLGLPHRPVVALVGDGGSLYTIQALWTAAHERVPVVIVVLNNRSYRILKQRTRALGGQSAASGKYLAMDLVDPEIDLVGLSRALGVPAVAATTIAEVTTAVADGLSSGQPLLIDTAVQGEL